MKLYLYILLFLFTVVNSYGQENYSVMYKEYTELDGLSSNITYAGVEDNKGVFWIGTQKGLTRFDGQYLKSFNQKNGIALYEVQHLFLDNEVLWCFQKSGQKYLVFLFHTLAERLLTFEEYLGQNLPFKQAEIIDIQFLAKGLIFHIQSKKTTKTYSYIPNKGFTELKFINTNNQILSITNDDKYWIINTEKEVEVSQVNALGKVLKNTNPDFFKRNIPNKILEIGEEYVDENNKIFIKFLTDIQFGFFSINSDGKLKYEGRRLRSTFDPKIEPPFDNFRYYFVDELLSYHLNNEISFYLRQDGQRLNMFSIPLKNGLGNCIITNRFILFLTNYGICVAEFRINKKPYPFKTFLKQEKIPARGIVTANEQLFINGYELYIANINLSSNYQKQFDNEGFGIIKDKSGNLWIERRNNLVYFDTKTQNLKTYKIDESPWALYEDEKGLIWYNTNKTLARLNPKTGKISTLPNSGLEKFKDLKIYHFHKKEDGLLLLSTNKGLFEVSLQKGVINSYSSNEAGENYLPANDFRHLYYDKKTSNYWLATHEGLIRWNIETADYQIFKFNNFAANTINAVYPDDYGHLWLSTENGIIQFDKSTFKYKTYLEKDGISHHEFNRVSHFQDTDPEGSGHSGTIYFGSLEGITVFHPKDFQTALKPIKNPKINVLELNQYLGSTNNLENLTADFYQQQEQIIVQPNDGYFTLKMSVSDYSLFSNVQILYKLKQSATWEVAKDNEITIRKLPYGQYILQIKAIGESGQFTDEYLEIPIFIKKPLYLKWWFWLIIGLFSIGLIFSITKWRTQEINRRNKELEQEVSKRTAQIESDKQTIEEQAERLLELDKTKSKFFANVSHELRTPITLIKGPIQSVLNSNNLDNRNFTLLSKAEQNTQNLLQLVNEILDLTKMEANKLTLDEEKVAFYPFLRRVISNFQSFGDIQNIDFIFNYKNLDKSLQLQLDERKLEKVLNNLLSNAFKFTPQNGQIEVVVEESDTLKASESFAQNGILITVKDNGRGISPDDVPYIFNRFYQSKTNTKAEGGLGIGLALSMEFIQLMNGKMWVESQIDGEETGSTFYVQIPKKEVIAKIQDADYELISSEEERLLNFQSLVNVKSDINTNKHTILLVEDNADLREYVSFLLSPFYNVVTANNGKEALEWLKKPSSEASVRRLPSAVISDVMMPIMDGFEFLEAVKSKAEFRNIPFIMLTARVELKDRLKALRIGVDDYLIKPFDETELLVRIENLLNNYEERQAFYNQIKGEKVEKTTEIEANNSQIITEAEQAWLAELEATILKEMNNSIFTVNYLAEAMNESRNGFFAKVKQLTGLSPNQYIRVIRLQKAKELLETAELSIAEIAQEVGFQSADYFSRLFKKEFGKSPSSYSK